MGEDLRRQPRPPHRRDAPNGGGRDHRDPEDAHGTGMELPTARRTRERAIPEPAPIRLRGTRHREHGGRDPRPRRHRARHQHGKLAGRPEPDHATDDPPAGWTGTRLAWHRTRQGLSQAELAIRAGQTTQTIGGIETRRWATGSKRSRIISTSPQVSASRRSTSWTKHRKENHA